jgi:DNA-binding transcriptional ArsR family regulator
MPMSVDPLSATFAALADPTRRAMLARLSKGEATVTELAEPFELSLPAISKHLKVLQRAGLVEQGRQAQWRPCTLKAGAAPRRLRVDRSVPPALGDSLERLDDYLREIQQDHEQQQGKEQG